jgi:ketosteroid isomerase-like protein
MPAGHQPARAAESSYPLHLEALTDGGNMSAANKQIARTFLKALGSGDVAALKSVMTDDVVGTTAGYSAISGSRNGAAICAIAAALPQITEAGVEFEILHLTAEDDRVAAEVQGHATMTNGKSYNNQYHFLFFIRDGRICKLMEYLDTELAVAVLGPYLPGAAN